MQPNTITLSVDDDNDGGTTAAVDILYTRFDEYQNRSEYISEHHLINLRDKVGLYRTFPKVSGNFKGMAKSAIKFTHDILVPGVDSSTGVTAPAIIDVNFSFPVGITASKALELRMRAVAFLSDDSVMIPLIDQQMI